MHICSIVAAHNGPAALVTLAALRGRHTDAEIHVLDVDGICADWPDVRVLTPADVGISRAELHMAGMLADASTLPEWLLPRLLRLLVSEGATAVYVAPGMRPVGDLSPIRDAAARSGLAAVARRDTLPPDDGMSPSPRDLVREGPFHAGMLGVGPGAENLLDAWIALSDPGLPAPWQTALSATAHELVGSATIISPWNVDPDSVIVDDAGTWTLNGLPVAAIDLTETDPARPWLFSTDGADTARARLSDHPDLAALVTLHLAEVAALEPAQQPVARFERTAGGIVVHSVLRRVFREAVEAWRAGAGPVPPDPFDTTRPEQFTQWLDEVVTRKGTPLTRYVLGLYRDRPDLQARYPHVPGSDSKSFIAWARVHAQVEGDYARERVAAGVATAARQHARPSNGVRTGPVEWLVGRSGMPTGVNVVGYLRGELGVGEAARLVLGALDTTDVPHRPFTVDEHLQSRQRADGDQAPAAVEEAAATFATTLLCVNADQAGFVLDGLPELNPTYRIGYWYWEVEDFPATLHGGFGHVDEIWAATDFVRESIAAHTQLPVVTMTPALPQRSAPTELTRPELGLPEDRTLFLFSFDHLSTTERKNPVDLIDAFRRAFAPGEGPCLVIKSINSDKRVGDAERVRLRAAAEPDVLLLEEYLPPAHRDALVQLCDAYVSLHRSEGLGLTIAEAMAQGKPVIATAYSGNMQFMTDANSYLVPWTPVPIPEHSEPYPVGGRWAQPDLDAAAACMRAVVDDPADAAQRGERAAQDLRTLHGPETAGRRMAARLAEIERDMPKVRWRERAARGRRFVRRVSPLS
ncbi:glycosyltransferase [Cellulomonas fengjieae]|uniref:Glycosyltransferase n=1 Tax=Cellulomonas fengjieae TaxID=2819978 RepID=A0ABS3SDL2_9CELL|nr:glycosyltransferase [Cellulomonas fengjieae]MBO3083846.1 glycosyltransferase [Cellulomonas fengjieae]QVI64868.1 glycosyltransferase [Cellulomonas fengjieae]